MQDYQLNKEDEFSQNQFDNSRKIVTYTIAQIVILLIIGIWQIFAFRKAFIHLI